MSRVGREKQELAIETPQATETHGEDQASTEEAGREADSEKASSETRDFTD